MSETFINIDSLQHLEISRDRFLLRTYERAYEPAKNPRYNIHYFDVMLIFPN